VDGMTLFVLYVDAVGAVEVREGILQGQRHGKDSSPVVSAGTVSSKTKATMKKSGAT